MSFYTISYYLKPWLVPPGFNCLMIFLGIVFWFYSRFIGYVLIISGVILLYALSTPKIAYFLVETLQNQYPILQASDFVTHDKRHVIVVLGGGNSIRAEYGNKRTIADSTLHRVNYAMYLQNRMSLPIITASGKSITADKQDHQLMSNYFKEKFNTQSNFVQNKTITTADESSLIVPILKRQRFDGVYLVTHAWHMPRSMYIFQCRGIKTIPAPMGHYRYQNRSTLISYFPSARALYVSSIVFHEWIGLVWYKLYYRDECVH